jgi:N-glycosylase/DNA lyase
VKIKEPICQGQLEAPDFQLGHSLGSGQAFRWGRDVDGWWKGIAYNVAMRLKQEGKTVSFCASSDTVETYAGRLRTPDFFRWYLRLDECPRVVVSRKDSTLKKARDVMKGLRFIRQDPFECMISYVLSVQAHMTLTKRRINLIAQTVGHAVEFEGNRYWAFPTPQSLATLDGPFYRAHRFGWRSERVADSARFVADTLADSKHVGLDQWRDISDALVERPGSGVGLKVGKCIDLFSLERLDAVPVDTWVRKFAESWYGVTGSDAKICKWAEDRWGKWAGYCNEYLFSYYRELHGGSLYDKVISFNATDEPSAELPFDPIDRAIGLQ